MKNKYWKQNKEGAWFLYFTPYSNKEFIFAIDKDRLVDKTWNYVSELLKVELDDFQADDLEEAKEIAEYMVLEHYKEQIIHYEEMVERWEEE